MSHFTPWESAGMPVQPAYCSSPNDRTTTGLSRVPVRVLMVQRDVLTGQSDNVMWRGLCNCALAAGASVGGNDAPFLSDGNGFMSKISTPCILPRISRRSRPVAWSKSVGIVPTGAPGGRRSSSVLISVVRRPKR